MTCTHQHTRALASITTLGGALRRDSDGWRWTDGETATQVRDMHLRDLAPNWRCRTYGRRCYVEIPHDWRDPRHWPRRHVDEDAASIHDHARRLGWDPDA